MAATERTVWPRLWISYPWASREEKDFTYLIAQLRDANIEATYDSLQLQPHAPLSQRIAQRLLSIDFDGWLYILTHQFLTHRTCADELIVAIEDAMQQKGPDFPMLGLLHGIAAQHVPPVLRVRPCLSVADPEWKHQLVAALNQHAPSRRREPAHENTRFSWRIHSSYGGDPSMTAIEVGSKVETIQYWRFAVPKPSRAARWGVGPAGGGEISPLKFLVARGTGRYAYSEVSWFGAANTVSNTESAYVVFCGPLPEFVCFGPADTPLAPPGQMEILRTALNR